jgi:GNAT superfamily N-acetyltransferase
MADGGSTTRSIISVGAIEGYELVKHLLPAHFDEIARFKEISVIKPDLARYANADKDNRFIGLIAMIGVEIVGYSANFLTHNLHYMDLTICQNDVLYVVPEHRASRVGLSLIRQTIRCAQERGLKLMVWHAKTDTALNQLLPRLGYEVLDVIWAKRI